MVVVFSYIILYGMLIVGYWLFFQCLEKTSMLKADKLTDLAPKRNCHRKKHNYLQNVFAEKKYIYSVFLFLPPFRTVYTDSTLWTILAFKMRRCFILTFPLKFYLHKKFKLSINDSLLLIYTFMCMVIFRRVIILSFQSNQTRILSAGLGMAWNRTVLCLSFIIIASTLRLFCVYLFDQSFIHLYIRPFLHLVPLTNHTTNK